MKKLEGKHNCFYCNYEISWQMKLLDDGIIAGTGGAGGLRLEVTAIDKNIFEIEFICSECTVKNKIKVENAQ